VCTLSRKHDNEMKTVHDKKGGSKQKPRRSTVYNNAMGGGDLSDQYVVTCCRMTQSLKKYYQKISHDLLHMTVFNSSVTGKCST
jgi:hypothetical protein